MAKDCEGICKGRGECTDPVTLVRVTQGTIDWGQFRYCQTAIEGDRKAGLTVEELESPMERSIRRMSEGYWNLMTQAVKP